MSKIKKVKIEIYVPEEYIKTIVNELTEIGACRISDYDHVVSYGKVFGYWRPGDADKILLMVRKTKLILVKNAKWKLFVHLS